MAVDKVTVMYSLMRSRDSAPPAAIRIAANAVKVDIDSKGMVTRNSDHLSLIASAYGHAISGEGEEYRELQEILLQLSAELLMTTDTSIKRLTTKLAWITRFGDSVEHREKTQAALASEVDPLARLLNDTAPRAPVFGPRLEDMLQHMNSLIQHRNDFTSAHGDGFESILFDDTFLAGMILNAFTLDAELLSKEMAVPTDSASMYPFGWMFHPGFTTHPVVKELNHLSAFLAGVDVDPSFRERAMTNFLGCVVNWCGEMALTDVHKSLSTPRSNRLCNAVIFDMIFAPERLEGALAVCKEKGVSVLAEYVLENHRRLGGKLPRQARAKNLESELGL